MQSLDIRSKCRINTNIESDTFVGIKCENGDINISFPLGFRISEDDIGLRKDILLLFSTLAKHTSRKDSQVLGQASTYNDVKFPIQSYIYVIKDFLLRGYYQEREVIYSDSKSGKINWNRTIKMKKPYIQDNEAFYLDFITKKNSIKDDKIITLIHEYCVYESFSKIGWLFTKSIPPKPRLKKSDKLFKTVLKEKILSTFNDKNKLLFLHLLSIIEYKGDVNSEENYRYGTYRFEYVWESMIDKVFGVSNKSDYFPRTYWRLKGKTYDNASLEPDTIMIHNNNVCVLDAKYYKYGAYPKNPGFLPESTSINKQITYGEYIAYDPKFKKMYGENMKVYNAFIMPFDSKIWNCTDQPYLCIGEAISNWKDEEKTYHHIKGILIDVKYLMKLKKSDVEIERLAKIIYEN